MAAAPTLTPKQQNKTLIAKKKKHNPKTTLLSPYVGKWPSLSNETSAEILDLLDRELNCIRIKSRKSVKWRKRLDAKKDSTSVDSADNQVKTRIDDDQVSQIRKHLALGYNCVTKCLEKSQLNLVIVDRTDMTSQMSWHLLQLCAVRKCSAVCVPGINSTLSRNLGLSTLLALGFKNVQACEEDPFKNLVGKISDKSIPVELPWILEEGGTDIIDRSTDSCSDEVKPNKTESLADEKHHDHMKQDCSTATGVHSPMNHSEQNAVIEEDISPFYVLKADRKAYENIADDINEKLLEEITQNNNTDANQLRKRKPAILSYEPSKLDKLKANPNRKKRKLKNQIP